MSENALYNINSLAKKALAKGVKVNIIRIKGVDIRQNDSGLWEITPLLLHGVKSEKTVEIIYEFGDKSPSISKDFTVKPNDSNKERFELEAQIFKTGHEGNIKIMVYMDKELKSALNVSFTSYLITNGVMQVHC